MTATYEPGTVAVATVFGVPNVRVMRVAANFSATSWVSAQGPGGRLHDAEFVTDVRPLVVLDLDQIGAHLHPKELERGGVVTMLRDTNSIAARKIADEIEAQAKPPRIPEPTGRWAVVEATGPHGRFQAVRWDGPSTRYWLDASGAWLDWDDLVDPVEIHAGMKAGA